MWLWTKRLADHAVESGRIQQQQTNSSLRIAEEANRLTNAMLVAQQRPWISLEVALSSGLSYDTRDGWHVVIQFRLKNAGPSPATRTSFTATLMPFCPKSWTEESLKGRSIFEMPTLGTDPPTELRKLAEGAMNGVKSEVGFGKTIFPGEIYETTFGIYGSGPLFDAARGLECYSGQFVLLVCAGYGCTLDDSAHITAKGFSLYKQRQADGWRKIDLAGESIGPGSLVISPFPDSKTDFAT
jgi:hypothetical protein